MAEGETKDKADGFPGDGKGHLGAAGDSIRENDRHLDDTKALAPGVIGGLDLEGIAIRGERAAKDGGKGRAAETFVARGRIHHGQARQQADVKASAVAEEESAQRPIEDAHAALVTRTDDKVIRLRRGKKPRQIGRIVREVGVHLDDAPVTARKRPTEGSAVGAAKPGLGRAMEHAETRMGPHQAFGEGAGAVRRGIVHNQQVGRRKRGKDSLDEAWEVLAFVVSGGDDERARRHQPASWATRRKSSANASSGGSVARHSP